MITISMSEGLPWAINS